MIIDFNQIPEVVNKNFYGGEKELVASIYKDENNKILRGKLVPDATIGLHTHETNSEVILILKGRGKVLYNGVYEAVNEGTCHYCPKGHSHSLINDSDDELIFFAIVPQH